MQQDGRFTIVPHVPPAVGDPVVFRDVYAVAKLDREKDGIQSSHNPDFSGPWDIVWNEEILV